MHFTKRTISYQLDSDHHLLINTLSGALDIVDGQVYKTAQGLATGDLDTALQLGPELEARFRKRFYLFDTEAEETAYCEALFKAMKQRLEKEPLQFAICPTYACNLRCTYCFEGQLTAGPVKIMTEDQLDHAFQSIEVLRDRFHPSSEARVILFGGEPLLRPAHSCVEQILLRSAQKGYGVDIVTNGVDAGHFADLLSAHRAAIKQIQITLDGPQEVHDQRRMFKGGEGTFKKITANVQKLLELGLPVTVRVNVDKDNVEQLPQLVEFIDQQGWNLFPNFSCYIFPVTAHSEEVAAHTLEEDKLLAKVQLMFQGEGKALPAFAVYGFKVLGHVASVIAPESISLKMPPLFTYCEANGLRYFGFGPDGMIYPCGQTIGQKDLAIGSYYPTLDLQERRCGDWQTRSVLTIPGCKECPIATLCGGGCAYGAYKQTSSILNPNCQSCGSVLEAYLGNMKEYLLHRYSGVLSLQEKTRPCA
jgi:uncharacterized protein